jgi:hypothetical protein
VTLKTLYRCLIRRHCLVSDGRNPYTVICSGFQLGPVGRARRVMLCKRRVLPRHRPTGREGVPEVGLMTLQTSKLDGFKHIHEY